MQELLLVNPRRRRKSRKARARKSGKRRSAAQRAATRKLLSFNRARRGGSKRRARRHSVVHSGVTHMARRRRRSARSSARRSRRYRRNPMALSIRGFTSRPLAMLTPAFQGAAGAVLVNTILSRLPLPPMLITGRMRYVTQAVAAVGLGALAQNFGVRGALAARMAEGSLTVTLTDVIRDFTAQAGFPLGNLGYYIPGRRANSFPASGGNAAQLVNGPMGKYVTGPGSGTVTPMRRMAGMGNVGTSFGF